MNQYKKYTTDIATIGVANLVLALRGIILLPIFSKILGTSGYGIWAQALVTLSLILPLSSLLLDVAPVRFLAGSKDRREIRGGLFSLLIFVLFWSSFIGLVLYLLSAMVADSLFGDISALPVVQLLSLVIPIDAINVILLGYFRAFRQMKTYSAFNIAKSFGEVILLAYVLLSGYGIVGAIISILIIRIAVNIIMFTIIVYQAGIGAPDFSRIKPYLKLCIPLIPSALSSWVTNSSDRYIIGIFLGISSVGIYSGAYILGSVIGFFSSPLATVLVPTLSKAYDEGRISEVNTYLSYSLKYFLMLAIPSAFGLSILASSLLGILSTPEFVPTGSIITPIIALSFVLFGVYVVLGQVYLLVKRTNISAILWAIAAAVNLGLNIILVPLIGVLGAALTTLFSFAMVTIFTIFFCSRYFKVDYHLSFILKSAVASVAMSGAIWWASPTQIGEVIMWIAAGIVIYFGILFLLRGFGKEEIVFLKKFFKRAG